MFFARFLLSVSRCMSDAITRENTADRENALGQPILCECMGICVLSPAHESEMRGYLVYVLIVKNFLILFKFSHSILDWTVLSWNGGGDFLKHFVCRYIIYKDYIVKRRFFIYCSLATLLDVSGRQICTVA